MSVSLVSMLGGDTTIIIIIIIVFNTVALVPLAVGMMAFISLLCVALVTMGLVLTIRVLHHVHPLLLFSSIIIIIFFLFVAMVAMPGDVTVILSRENAILIFMAVATLSGEVVLGRVS